jgi:hypothetical protein
MINVIYVEKSIKPVFIARQKDEIRGKIWKNGHLNSITFTK